MPMRKILQVVLLTTICVNANCQDFWSDEPSNLGSTNPQKQHFDAERARIEATRRDMFADVQVPQRNSFPKIDDNQFKGGDFDIEAIAARYKEQVRIEQQHDRVMVFISFSMPMESIKRIVQETSKIDGVVVLRGFVDGSYQKTAEIIATLGEKRGNIQVNPEAFKKYKIEQVPSIILVQSDQEGSVDSEGCALPGTFIGISGDVSLPYALNRIKERGNSEQKSISARYLLQLGGRQ